MCPLEKRQERHYKLQNGGGAQIGTEKFVQQPGGGGSTRSKIHLCGERLILVKEPS